MDACKALKKHVQIESARSISALSVWVGSVLEGAWPPAAAVASAMASAAQLMVLLVGPVPGHSAAGCRACPGSLSGASWCAHVSQVLLRCFCQATSSGAAKLLHLLLCLIHEADLPRKPRPLSACPRDAGLANWKLPGHEGLQLVSVGRGICLQTRHENEASEEFWRSLFIPFASSMGCRPSPASWMPFFCNIRNSSCSC